MAVVEFIIRGVDQSGAAVKSATAGISSAVGLIKTAVAGLSLALAGDALATFFRAGIKAADDFLQSVVKTAAMITSLQGGENVAENYRQAKAYAEGLQKTLMEVDAQSTMNIGALQAITEEMVKQGIVLDVNSKSQVESFTRLANAVAVYSQNGEHEVQVRQEVSALLRGEVDQNSQLASMLQKTVDGPLKQKVQQWKDSGALIEEIGKRLSGFGPAAEDLGKSWSAVSSSLRTAVDLILRSGFQAVVADLVTMLGKGNDWLKAHAELIGNRIQQAWLAVKGLVESVGSILGIFSGPLEFIATATGGILKGWGLLLTAVFPPLMARLGAFGQGLWATLSMLGNLAGAAMTVLTGNFSGASSYLAAAKSNFAAMGKAVGETFKTGLIDEIGDRAIKFLSLDNVNKSTAKPVETPKIQGMGDETALVKAFRKQATDIIKIEEDRIKTLIEKEEAYIKTMEATYEQHLQRLNAFADALSEVRASQKARDKSAADAARGPESALAAQARQLEELFAQIADLSTSFADPAGAIRSLNQLEISSRDLFKEIKDGDTVIYSAEQANYDYAIAQDKVRSAIDKQVAAMDEQEKQTVDAAQAIINAKDRVAGYKLELESLDTLLRGLPKVTDLEVNLKVNGLDSLAGISSAVGYQNYGEYYTMGGKTYWADGSLADNGTSFVGSPAGDGSASPFVALNSPFAGGTRYVPKTGFYPLHQGEEVRNRGEVADNKRAVTITFAPNITMQGGDKKQAEENVRELARLLTPELRRLGGLKFP